MHKHIQGLESRNYVRRLFNQSRSLEVSAKYLQERRKGRAAAPRADEIPLAGRIAAGAPVEAIEGRETLQFADFTGKGDTFALEVAKRIHDRSHISERRLRAGGTNPARLGTARSSSPW